jgi:hypothetical protein
MGIRASDVIQIGETAIVLFTHGDNFRFEPDTGNGESGNWKVSTDVLEFITRVIVYFRPNGGDINHIYLGNYSGYRKSEESDRWIIRFKGLSEYGVTDLNWLDFSESSQNPVHIISK